MQEPVVERAIEDVERDLDLRVSRDLAALDRTVEYRACLVTTGLDEAFAVFGGEHGVGLCLGDERGDHAPVRPAAGEPGPGAQE